MQNSKYLSFVHSQFGKQSGNASFSNMIALLITLISVITVMKFIFTL